MRTEIPAQRLGDFNLGNPVVPGPFRATSGNEPMLVGAEDDVDPRRPCAARRSLSFWARPPSHRDLHVGVCSACAAARWLMFAVGKACCPRSHGPRRCEGGGEPPRLRRRPQAPSIARAPRAGLPAAPNRGHSLDIRRCGPGKAVRQRRPPLGAPASDVTVRSHWPMVRRVVVIPLLACRGGSLPNKSPPTGPRPPAPRNNPSAVKRLIAGLRDVLCCCGALLRRSWIWELPQVAPASLPRLVQPGCPDQQPANPRDPHPPCHWCPGQPLPADRKPPH